MNAADLLAGRFRIERVAGSGGMGIVYRAHDLTNGRPVAIKVLQPEAADDRDRFEREALLLSGAIHPAIVGYVAHGVTPEGRPYLAMEWIDGNDLAFRLESGRLSVAEALILGERVAEALGAAHAKGIVHRDIKPANLLLPQGDVRNVVLLDFGIARVEGTRRATRTGSVIGTPAYMAPEQARGSRDVGPPADVFSLGCVLFECLTARPPFLGDHAMAVLVKILLDEAPRASDLLRNLPPLLDDLIASMLSKEPSARPADGAAVARALSEIKASLLPGPATATSAPVSRAAPSRAGQGLTTGEQRLLCVVLASPERGVSAAIGAHGTLILQRVDGLTALLQPFGATVEVLAGGAVVATIAGEGAATDHAAQGARAALVLQQHMPGAAVALATGRGRVGGAFPAGEVIDRAAALIVRAQSVQATPALRGIRIDEVTAALVDARFEVAQGPDGGSVLLGERAEVDRVRTLCGRPTPCVGRDREFAILTGMFDEAAREPVARGALLLGAAGTGKSRLRYELVRHLRGRPPTLDHAPPQIWASRGDPMWAGAPFGLLAPLVRRLADIHDGEPIALRREKLVERAARHLPATEVSRVAEFLGEMIGAPFPDHASVRLRAARQDPALLRDQMQRAWVDFCAAEASRAPLVWVLDDIHWGDAPSLTLVEATYKHLADLPLLIVAFGRPEVREAFPHFANDLGFTEVHVGELTKKSSEKLVRGVLGDGVPAAVVERIVLQSQGNALYLEELIRAVSEGRGDRLPESVVAITLARLERLDPESRRALRAASLFGDVFWIGAVQALTGGAGSAGDVRALASLLDDLARRELVTRRSESRFPGEVELVFRHATVREAAYGMLTDEDRAMGHALAGDWLEKAGETNAATLADHFERAEAWGAGSEAGSGAPSSRMAASERACSHTVRAVEQALAASDLEGVLRRVDRALTGPGAARWSGELKGRLLLARARARRWTKDAEAHADAAREATEHLPEGSTAWLEAIRELLSAYGGLTRRDAIEAISMKLVALAGETQPTGTARSTGKIRSIEAIGMLVSAMGRAAIMMIHLGAGPTAGALIDRMADLVLEHDLEDPVVEAAYQHARAVWQLYTGDLAGSAASNERAIVGYQAMGDLPAVCMERSNLANCYIELGEYDKAEQATREALATAERLGLARVAASAKINLGLALSGQGRFEEAIQGERDMAEALTQGGDPRYEAAARLYLAYALCGARRFREARAEADRAVALAARIPPIRAYALAIGARASLGEQDLSAAKAAATEAMELVRSLGGVDSGEGLIRLAYVESLAATGAPEQARSAARDARDWLFARADKIKDPAVRTRFLSAVPENAAIVRASAEKR